jgi:hypothetical protein
MGTMLRRHAFRLGATALILALGAPDAAPQGQGAPAEPIDWITDFEAGLALAKKTQRPMLVDFWCGT